MNLEKLALLKVRRKMYAWAVEDCDVWMNEIKRMGGNPAVLIPFKNDYLKTLKEIDGEISRIRDVIESLEDKTVSKILSMRYDEGMKIGEIADKMYFSSQWVHELIKRGMNQI